MNCNSFKDAQKFGYCKNGKIIFKNDSSSWVKVFLNNLPLDDYLFHEQFYPSIICNFKFTKQKTNSIVKNIKKKKMNAILDENEENENYKTISWDTRPRCKYCKKILVNLNIKGEKTFEKECPNLCDLKYKMLKFDDYCYICGYVNQYGNLCLDCRPTIFLNLMDIYNFI